jgi:hypothetical protein
MRREGDDEVKGWRGMEGLTSRRRRALSSCRARKKCSAGVPVKIMSGLWYDGEIHCGRMEGRKEGRKETGQTQEELKMMDGWMDG